MTGRRQQQQQRWKVSINIAQRHTCQAIYMCVAWRAASVGPWEKTNYPRRRENKIKKSQLKVSEGFSYFLASQK
jgi:hypothetical protein